MARKAGWRILGELRQSRRRALAVAARRYTETGEQKYYERYKKYVAYSNSVIRESNKRLRELEAENLAYGKAYNSLSYYLESELRTRRLPSTKSLSSGRYDIDTDNSWFISVEQGLKFLKQDTSNAWGMMSSNYYRVHTLQEHGVLPREFDGRTANWRDFDGFLRFLGNEEVAASIEAYGQSDMIVDMLWDYWSDDSKNRASNEVLMKMSLAQYLSGYKTFDEALLDRGVKVEDYMVRKAVRDKNNL